jgi:uncharacterized protein
MPANLSPEYKAAEAAFRKAREPRERLEWLREMLRTIPKHKGTEHPQANIKARIRDLAEEFEGPKRAGAHGGPTHVIDPEGAAQIALVGPPNAGKSLLHARLTGSGAHAVSAEHPLPWLANTLQTADAALLVVDLCEPECVEQLADVHATLRAKGITLTERWSVSDNASRNEYASDDDPFAMRLPTLMLANKSDRVSDPEAELVALCELAQLCYPTLSVSASTGHGLGELGPWLFRQLGIVRVYTKAPHRPPDRGPPFTLHRGQTVRDLARLVHKDLEQSLRFARVWGHTGFDGQQVGPDHPMADRDVVELHS